MPRPAAGGGAWLVEGRLRSLRSGSAGRFFEDDDSGGVACGWPAGPVLTIEEVASDGGEMILDGGWPGRLVSKAAALSGDHEHAAARPQARRPGGLDGPRRSGASPA